MWKEVIVGLAVVGLGIGAWLATRGDLGELLSGENKAAQEPPAGKGAWTSPTAGISVEAAPATAATASLKVKAIGSLQSDESVQIASEIAGRVTEIPLPEGSSVAAGDILIKLDDALARAEVDDMQARYEFAKGNLGRANMLARSGNVTERARDEATANSATAQATLELAKVRLSKHVIHAPFSGVVGIRKVSPGAYIAVGQPIVNVEKIDTLKVDFKLPELYLGDVKIGQTVDITVDALPGRTFEGTIYAIDPMVDVNGRALVIRAKLANPDQILRPGLFARILVKGTEGRSVVVVPESAIVPRGTEKIVYAIENGKAVETLVTLGERREGLVEIVAGLKTDAMVVTAGQQKLRNGSPVEIVARDTSLEPRKGS